MNTKAVFVAIRNIIIEAYKTEENFQELDFLLAKKAKAHHFLGGSMYNKAFRSYSKHVMKLDSDEGVSDSDNDLSASFRGQVDKEMSDSDNDLSAAEDNAFKKLDEKSKKNPRKKKKILALKEMFTENKKRRHADYGRLIKKRDLSDKTLENKMALAISLLYKITSQKLIYEDRDLSSTFTLLEKWEKNR